MNWAAFIWAWVAIGFTLSFSWAIVHFIHYLDDRYPKFGYRVFMFSCLVAATICIGMFSE